MTQHETFALESFITMCDEMQIAEESSVGGIVLGVIFSPVIIMGCILIGFGIYDAGRSVKETINGTHKVKKAYRDFNKNKLEKSLTVIDKTLSKYNTVTLPESVYNSLTAFKNKNTPVIKKLLSFSEKIINIFSQMDTDNVYYTSRNIDKDYLKLSKLTKEAKDIYTQLCTIAKNNKIDIKLNDTNGTHISKPISEIKQLFTFDSSIISQYSTLMTTFNKVCCSDSPREAFVEDHWSELTKAYPDLQVHNNAKALLSSHPELKAINQYFKLIDSMDDIFRIIDPPVSNYFRTIVSGLQYLKGSKK